MLTQLSQDARRRYQNFGTLCIKPEPRRNLHTSYHNATFDHVGLLAHTDTKFHPWLTKPFFLETQDPNSLLDYYKKQQKKVPASLFVEIAVVAARVKELEGGLEPLTVENDYDVIEQAYREFLEGRLQGSVLFTENNQKEVKVSLQDLHFRHEPEILFGSLS